MATFPTLTISSPLNTIPSSTAPGTYDNLLSFPLPTIADADKVLFFGIDSYTYKEAFIGTAGREEINSLTSSGVISGMVISISGSTISVSAGKYVVKDNPQGGDEAYTVIDFPGVTGFTLSNPSSLSYGFLNIDASQNITFDDMPKKRQSVCLGGLKVNGTTPLKIFNTGHRLANSTDQFEQFINDLGVFHKGITVSLDASGNLETDGGYVYTGSFYKGRLVQASQKLTFEKVNDEGTTDPEQDVLTLDELKKFYPPGGSETDLTGNNQYVIWYIFVTTDGLFLLLKPQKEINPPGQNAINDEDLYMTYEEAIKPEIVTSGATLVGCLIVNGNATALTDIINEDLVDNKLSSSGGRKTNTQTFSAPIPQLSDVEKAWEPAIGTYQLATDGTDYKIKKGLQGASQLPDGILCRHIGYQSAGLRTTPEAITATGSLAVPEIYYISFSFKSLFGGDLKENTVAFKTNIVGLTKASFFARKPFGVPKPDAGLFTIYSPNVSGSLLSVLPGYTDPSDFGLVRRTLPSIGDFYISSGPSGKYIAFAWIRTSINFFENTSYPLPESLKYRTDLLHASRKFEGIFSNTMCNYFLPLQLFFLRDRFVNASSFYFSYLINGNEFGLSDADYQQISVYDKDNDYDNIIRKAILDAGSLSAFTDRQKTTDTRAYHTETKANLFKRNPRPFGAARYYFSGTAEARDYGFASLFFLKIR